MGNSIARPLSYYFFNPSEMTLIRQIAELLKQTYLEWREDRADHLAAALAFYTIFSLAPLLIVAISLASIIWGRSVIEAQVLFQMQEILGSDGSAFIHTVLKNVSNHLGGGLLVNLLGVTVLIFSAIGIFRELRSAMNIIWEVTPGKKKGFWRPIKRSLLNNLFSFAMVVGLGLLFAVSVVINSSLSVLRNFTSLLFFSNVIMNIINFSVTLVVISLIFALLFKVLADTYIGWRDVLLGGLVTAILFILGKTVIGFYLANSSIVDSYGAAGSLVLLLIWVYCSALILFLGAEFTQVYANTYGSKAKSLNKENPYSDIEYPKEKSTNEKQVSSTTYAEK